MKQRLERALEVAKGAILAINEAYNLAVCKTALAEIDAILHPVEVASEEVVRWFNPDIPAYRETEPVPDQVHKWVKLVGTICREKKVVERSVSGEVVWRDKQGYVYPVGKDINFDWESIIGKTGTLTFEWTE